MNNILLLTNNSVQQAIIKFESMGKVRGILSSLLLKTKKNNKPKLSADADVMFEYTGDGCSVPKNVTSVLFKEGLQKILSLGRF